MMQYRAREISGIRFAVSLEDHAIVDAEDQTYSVGYYDWLFRYEHTCIKRKIGIEGM